MNSLSISEENNAVQVNGQPEDDFFNNEEWKGKKHIFILSSAGKPVYSR